MRVALIGSLGSLLFVCAAFAQQAPRDPAANAQFAALRPAGTPYRALFSTGAKTADAAAQPRAEQGRLSPPPKGRIVCGMTLIEGDASIDPGIAIAPKKEGAPTPTIRAIEPPICKS